MITQVTLRIHDGVNDGPDTMPARSIDIQYCPDQRAPESYGRTVIRPCSAASIDLRRERIRAERSRLIRSISWLQVRPDTDRTAVFHVCTRGFAAGAYSNAAASAFCVI